MNRCCFLSTMLSLLLASLWATAAFGQDVGESGRVDVEKSGKERLHRRSQIDEVVVTATRVETPAREVGSSVTVITSEQIEQQKKPAVLDVLRSAPSLDVVQTGGPGGATSVFIRGAKSEHTLVLIDGVEMNDPVTAGRSFDFADMTTDNIERIEILRGPQSTLYGSDAIGGVINIITKTGEGKPKGFVSIEGGSFGSFREAGGVNGGAGPVHYSLGFSRQDTDGISVAGEKYGNRERDGYGNTTVSGKVGIAPIDALDIDVIFRRVDAAADMDDVGGTGGDDPNSMNETTQHFVRTEARLSLLQGVWNQKIGFSFTDHARTYDNGVDRDHPSDSSHSIYRGRSYRADWQNDFHVHRTNIMTFGLEMEDENGESTYRSQSAWGPYTSEFKGKSARIYSGYLQDQVRLFGSWFTTLGVRLDDHTTFGSEPTYRVASAYVFESAGTKIKASYGTGFKAPSLYQLYSSYGNERLKPEENAGWDVGIEQSFIDGKLAFDLAYFSNDFENMVDFNSITSRYSNVAQATTRGIEFSGAFQATESFSLRGSYTYTDAEDDVTGLDLLRRARNKVGFDGNYRFSERGNINVNLTCVGRRADMNYAVRPAARVATSGYVLANLAASFNMTRRLQLFGRINNLLDREYEEIVGYGTPGISAHGGIRVSF